MTWLYRMGLHSPTRRGCISPEGSRWARDSRGEQTQMDADPSMAWKQCFLQTFLRLCALRCHLLSLPLQCCPGTCRGSTWGCRRPSEPWRCPCSGGKSLCRAPECPPTSSPLPCPGRHAAVRRERRKLKLSYWPPCSLFSPKIAHLYRKRLSERHAKQPTTSVFVFSVKFRGGAWIWDHSKESHLEVLPTLGGVFGVQLLLWGAWRAAHIWRVVIGVVARVISSPSSCSQSGLQIQEKSRITETSKIWESNFRMTVPQIQKASGIQNPVVKMEFTVQHVIEFGSFWMNKPKALQFTIYQIVINGLMSMIIISKKTAIEIWSLQCLSVNVWMNSL